MDLRKINLDNIKWETKSREAQTSNCDISVVYGKDGAVNLTFRNDVFENITTTGYFQLAIIGTALLFKEADRKTGRKGTLKTSGNYHCTITKGDRLKKWAEEHHGNYTVRLFKNYIYIDAESTKED